MASWWFVGLVAGILFTPGPTNTLLATAGLQSGWLRAAKLIPFELAGYVVAISVWGYGMAQMTAQWPPLPTLMKTLSAVYLAYLAMRLPSSVILKLLQSNIAVASGSLAPNQIT